MISEEEINLLLGTVWPCDGDDMRACVGIWLTQDILISAVAKARTTASGSLQITIPLLPQRFNGPCGLLASLQAEMLRVAMAEDAAPLSSAVSKILRRAAKCAGVAGRVVTALTCPCGHLLEETSPSPPSDEGLDSQTLCANCSAPGTTSLHWAGSLWTSLKCPSCKTQVCMNCAGIVTTTLDDGAIDVPGHRGSALMLLYSLVLSSNYHVAEARGPPLVGTEDGAVFCSDALVTLALWGAAPSDDLRDVATRAAAVDGDDVVGVLVERTGCFAPRGAAPTVWLGLAGGHWRVVCDDKRVVASSEGQATANGPVSSSCFSVVQIDGLPGPKTKNSAISCKIVSVRAPRGVSDFCYVSPKIGASSNSAKAAVDDAALAASIAEPVMEPRDRAVILGKRKDAEGNNSYHIVWEANNTFEEAFGQLAGDDSERWYCRTCYFHNDRENLLYGMDGWRNSYNPAGNSPCHGGCGQGADSCGRSRWMSESDVAKAAPALLDSYTSNTADLLELTLRARWPGAVALRFDENTETA